MKKIWTYLAIAFIFSIGSLVSFPLGVTYWKGLVICLSSTILTTSIIFLVDFVAAQIRK